MFSHRVASPHVKIRNRYLTIFVGWSVALIFRLLARTLRYEGHHEAAHTYPAGPTERRYIYSLWHDSILIPLALAALGNPKIAALVSRHQDGSYLAEFMRYCHVRSIRGSSSRGGAQAMREMLAESDDYHIFITPDGPRGPHHELKEGIVFLASHTGRPIIPVASLYPSAWHLKGSWTGLWVPKPFSRCYYLLGVPLVVPPDLTREQLAEQRQRLQSEMDRMEAKLARIVRGEPEQVAERRRAA